MVSKLTNSCWNALLLLKKQLRLWDEPVRFCFIQFGAKEQVTINSYLEPASDCITALLVLDKTWSGNNYDIPFFAFNGIIELEEHQADSIPEDIRSWIKLYAPYCFLSVISKEMGRTIVVSHFAQTLDGRIATVTGDSKWIGNKSNRIHAHRMRALSDGVLIGTGTVKRDNPKLTVRHIDGLTPIRIVLGSSSCNLNSLLEASYSPIWILTDTYLKSNKGVEVIEFKSENGYIPTLEILKFLYDRDIKSVYIEGGTKTTSQFLRENNIDILQLHFSPMIFGSGYQSFVLPEVKKVSDSVHFKSQTFIDVGDSIMFVGEVEKQV